MLERRHTAKRIYRIIADKVQTSGNNELILPSGRLYGQEDAEAMLALYFVAISLFSHTSIAPKDLIYWQKKALKLSGSYSRVSIGDSIYRITRFCNRFVFAINNAVDQTTAPTNRDILFPIMYDFYQVLSIEPTVIMLTILSVNIMDTVALSDQ